MTVNPGKLYLVPTPIGNLGDMTPRALDVLKEADIVACEDTRTSGRLLSHFGLKKKLVSYHEFNERSKAARLIEGVRQGQTLAVVSDAGTPGISDPAYRIVRAAIDNDIPIEALPGANALLPALTASGLPTDRFFFEGFLSHKSAARRRRLEEVRMYEHTLVFYESVHRVQKCVADMADILGDRRACIGREISKKFEEYLRGTLTELSARLSQRSLKGEFVIVVEGNRETDANTE